MTIKEAINKYFDFVNKKVSPKTAKLLKVLNIIIFICMLVTGSYMLWINQVQIGFDIYVMLALYMIFTKLEKLDKRID